MNFNFKLSSGKTVRVFFNKLTNNVSWNCSDNWKEYKEASAEVETDKAGKKFFRTPTETIYMDDFIAYTPEELVDIINKSTRENCKLFGDDLVHTLLKYGIDSIHVIRAKKPLNGITLGGIRIGFDDNSFVTNRAEWDSVEYKFEEHDMFDLVDNYKIKLVPASEADRDKYAYETMYISDLFDLMVARPDIYKVTLPSVK